MTHYEIDGVDLLLISHILLFLLCVPCVHFFLFIFGLVALYPVLLSWRLLLPGAIAVAWSTD